MDPLTEADYERTRELQKFLASCHLSENSDMKEVSLSKIDDIVKTCVKHMVQKGQISKMQETLVLESGSYSLEVHAPSDELEFICVGPPDVNRQEFFENLHEVLRNSKEIANLEPVQKERAVDKQCSDQEAVDRQRSAARVLKFKLYGQPTVLHYAILSEVPAERSAVFEDSVLSCVDEANLAILDKCRSANMIPKLVPNIENFRTTLRYMNFWARRRGVYSNMAGFLGGIQWSVMVARVCQIYPRAVPSILVMKVFEEYSCWFWPSPVMLCSIERKAPFTVWNAPGNKVERSHVMPIITPAYPCRNSSAYVSESTLLRLKEEFTLGFNICEKIKKGEASWSALSEPHEFFKLYARYLLLDINVEDADDLWLWKLKVEPLWRELPLKVKAHGDGTMRGHLHPRAYYDHTNKHCFLFMGLSKISKGDLLGQQITTPLPIPREIQGMFQAEADKLKGPGMEIASSHYLQQRVEPFVSKLVSDYGLGLQAPPSL